MKKLCSGKGRRIHPAPPQPAAGTAAWQQLAALPAALVVLAAALTPEEQEVLAYLLSGGGGAVSFTAGDRWRGQSQRKPHPSGLGCGCFGCYQSFWARWDASPNRHVIHSVIEAVEEGVELGERGNGGGRRRRRRSGPKGGTLAIPAGEEAVLVPAPAEENESFGAEGKRFPELDMGHVEEEDDGSDEVDREDDGEEINNENSNVNSSVMRFVNFIGLRVWGVLN